MSPKTQQSRGEDFRAMVRETISPDGPDITKNQVDLAHRVIAAQLGFPLRALLVSGSLGRRA